jgi:hypothetical protein
VTCVRWWFSLDTPVSSTNKTDRHNITVILLKVALTTITLNPEYNDWIIRVIKHTGIITNHIISVKLPYKYKYTKIAPYYFQQYYSYIVAVSFIGGGNRGIQGKPPPDTSH